jgi:hypothetical protein
MVIGVLIKSVDAANNFRHNVRQRFVAWSDFNELLSSRCVRPSASTDVDGNCVDHFISAASLEATESDVGGFVIAAARGTS